MTLFFIISVIYPYGLIFNVKLFDNDTSLFAIINCFKASASVPYSDLLKIQDWAHQWKMSFNPYQTKQSQEVIFSTKTNKIVYPPLLQLFIHLL